MRRSVRKKETPKKCLLVLGVIVVTLWTQEKVQAYRTAVDLPLFSDRAAERVAWRQEEVFFSVEGVPAGALQRALGIWNGVDCTHPALVASSSPGVDVSVVAIADWDARGLPSAEAGVTYVAYEGNTQGWDIVGAEIWINQRLIAEESLRLEVVLAHEVGHAVGLAHPCELDGLGGCTSMEESALLHPLYDATARSMPDSDDIAGYCWLYEDLCAAGCQSSMGDEGDACTTDRECRSGTCSAAGLCAFPCDGGRCPVRYQCREGTCEPLAGGFADGCRAGSECASGLCLTRSGDGMCTRPCGAGCPEGTACVALAGQAVCESRAESCGVVVVGASTSPATGLGLWGLAMLWIVRRRMNRA